MAGRRSADRDSGRMSTINDVAQAAGVSVATVSRALHGLDRVSEQTRSRVLTVAAELNYVASPTATSLASGRTRVIAVATPFLSRWFFATLVSAIEKSLRQRDHHVLLFDLEDDSVFRRHQLTQNMLWKRVDGLITLNLSTTAEEDELLDRLGLPMVTVGTGRPGRPNVRIDDRAAARLATEHLLGLGHTRIAFVGSLPGDGQPFETPVNRLAAFEEAIGAAGLSTPPDWVVACEWTADSALTAMTDLLTGAARPTAVVAGSDEMAFGVIRAAQRLGLDVPGHLSVVGIDDHYLSRVLGITTVRQDVEAQGVAAAETMLGILLEGQPARADSTILPVELVVRESTRASRT